MRAREMMNDFVVEVSPEDSVLAAAVAMKVESVGVVCVCEPVHVPIGVLTDRDIVLRVCSEGADSRETHVRQVMTPRPLTCHLETPASEVEALMVRYSVERILVVDDEGQLAGLISLAEVWHHESPLTAGALSRHVTQRQLRVQSGGAQHRPSCTAPRPDPAVTTQAAKCLR